MRRKSDPLIWKGERAERGGCKYQGGKDYKCLVPPPSFLLLVEAAYILVQYVCLVCSALPSLHCGQSLSLLLPNTRSISGHQTNNVL